MSAEPLGSFDPRHPRVSFSPPAAVRAEAREGLELQHAHGTPQSYEVRRVGLLRAKQLATGHPRVTLRDMVYMRAFFARHEVDDKRSLGAKIAHKIWGGTPAKQWVNRVLDEHGL